MGAARKMSLRAKVSARLTTSSVKDDDGGAADAVAVSSAAAAARASISEAARSIRLVLAKGLAGRSGRSSTARKENDEPGGGAPLVRRFRELQADRAEQDKVIAALRSMLRDKGVSDSRVDQAVDAALFKGVDMKAHDAAASAGGLPVIAPGASRELLMRELRNLKVRAVRARFMRACFAAHAELAHARDTCAATSSSSSLFFGLINTSLTVFLFFFRCSILFFQPCDLSLLCSSSPPSPRPLAPFCISSQPVLTPASGQGFDGFHLGDDRWSEDHGRRRQPRRPKRTLARRGHPGKTQRLVVHGDFSSRIRRSRGRGGRRTQTRDVRQRRHGRSTGWHDVGDGTLG